VLKLRAVIYILIFLDCFQHTTFTWQDAMLVAVFTRAWQFSLQDSDCFTPILGIRRLSSSLETPGVAGN
jgi:hypothetical protein